MKKIERNVLMDWWLQKFHNTNIEEVITTHPKEVLESPDWFKLFPCTQEQCDEWEMWAKDYLRKEGKFPQRMVDRGWGLVFLDCAPYVSRTADEVHRLS